MRRHDYAPTNMAQPQGQLYVAVPFFSSQSLGTGNGALLRFDNPAMLTGNVTPAATVTGDLVPMNVNEIVASSAFDAIADRMFVLVVSSTGGAILVFDHMSTKNGNVAPDRVIEGSSTGLLAIGPMVVDASRDILYVESGVGAGGAADVLVFKNASTLNGNVAPSTVLELDPANSTAADLALDQANDRLFALMGGTSISVFDHASTRVSGVMVADRVISAASLNGGSGHIALDPGGRLLVAIEAGTNPPNIKIFANAGAANGDVSPVATITGSLTGLDSGGAEAMTVYTGPGASPGGDLYVNTNFGNVLVFNNIATADGNIAPGRTFAVPTVGNGNLQLTVDASR